MKQATLLIAALGVAMLGGCATYSSDPYYRDGPWVGFGVYDGYGGYDGRDRGRHSRSGSGRSEPGNEAGMFPGRPGDGRGGVGSGSGDARGGEAGSR